MVSGSKRLVGSSGKRNLAPFYTPRRVAQALADWAITDPNVSVLDPSFGGCAFLYAASDTLHRLGNPAPASQIHGVDIDPDARSYLRPLLQAGAAPEHFVTADFFGIAPSYFGNERFGAVIGNPPYVRYHDIPDDALRQAVARLRSVGIRISGRASYWAYFLLYSMHFLRQGGRLGMVLPGAFLQTDYSHQVRKLLIRHFEQVTIYLLQERVFDGTQEESVLLCAAGAGNTNRALRLGAVARAADMERGIDSLYASTRVLDKSRADGAWLHALVEPGALDLYEQLAERPNVIRMGEWVRTRIGVVTGRNEYFILSRSEQEERSIPSDCLVPVLRRPSSCRGLWVRNEDLEILAKNGSKFLLLAVGQAEHGLPRSVREYIRYGQETGVSKGRKCRDRRPWYVVPHTFAPPAFMQCMSAAWPRLVVNESAYTCTNNILRVLWKEERPRRDWVRIALGTLSTLSQLSAELVGRSYGGGVLKLEPKELAGLVVPLVPMEIADELARDVDSLLRAGELWQATSAVDSALLDAGIGLDRASLERLRLARDQLFLRRRQHRKDAQTYVDASRVRTT